MHQELFTLIQEKGLHGEEIVEKVKQKQAQFHNLLTDEAALRILARENGVKLEKKEKEINGFDAIVVGQPASGFARIMFIGEPRKFASKNNDNGLVVNVGIAHGGGDATLVLWNRDAREFLSTGARKNELILIKDALVKNLNPLELHTTLITRIEKLLNIEESQMGQINKIKPALINKMPIAKITAPLETIDLDCFIKKVAPVKTFNTNGKQGKLCRLEISDETGSTNLVCWGEFAEISSKLLPGRRISCDNLCAKLNKLTNAIELHTTFQTRIIESKEKTQEKGEKENGKEKNSNVSNLHDGDTGIVECTVKKLLEVKPIIMCSKCRMSLKAGSGKCQCGGEPEETIVAEAIIIDAAAAGEKTEMRCSFYDHRALHLLGMKSIAGDIAATIAKLKGPELEGKNFTLKISVKQNNFLNALSATCREFM